VVADEDESLVEAAEVHIAPWTIECDPPFEHGSRDVQAPWHDTVKLAGILRADVDEPYRLRVRPLRSGSGPVER
jgi:hypothetical protein